MLGFSLSINLLCVFLWYSLAPKCKNIFPLRTITFALGKPSLWEQNCITCSGEISLRAITLELGKLSPLEMKYLHWEILPPYNYNTSTGETFHLRPLTHSSLRISLSTVRHETHSHKAHTPAESTFPWNPEEEHWRLEENYSHTQNQTAAIMIHLFLVQNQLRGPKHCPSPKNSPQSQPWLSTNYEIKKQVLEPSVFLHWFNPITPKAEADRSLVRPG